MAEKKGILSPLEVSPLIKAVRWTCLISGIIYGFGKQRKYAELERILRTHEEKTRAAREEYLAREKRLRDEAELKELERIFLGTDSSNDNNETVNEAPSNRNTILEDNEIVTDGITKTITIVTPSNE